MSVDREDTPVVADPDTHLFVVAVTNDGEVDLRSNVTAETAIRWLRGIANKLEREKDMSYCPGGLKRAKLLKMDLDGEKYKALCPECLRVVGWFSGGKVTSGTVMVVPEHQKGEPT